MQQPQLNKIKIYENKISSQSLDAGVDRRLAGTAVNNTGRAEPALQTHRLGDVWRSLERPPKLPGNCKQSRDGYRRSRYRRSRSVRTELFQPELLCPARLPMARRSVD